jgi:hypothetical protein
MPRPEPVAMTGRLIAPLLIALVCVPAVLWWTRGWSVRLRLAAAGVTVLLIVLFLLPPELHLGLVRWASEGIPGLDRLMASPGAAYAVHALAFAFAGVVFGISVRGTGDNAVLGALIAAALFDGVSSLDSLVIAHPVFLPLSPDEAHPLNEFIALRE